MLQIADPRPEGSPLSLADVVKELRTERGLSREALAFRSGVSSSLIERIELRGHIPKLAGLRAVAKGLGVPAATLIDAINGEAA